MQGMNNNVSSWLLVFVYESTTGVIEFWLLWIIGKLSDETRPIEIKEVRELGEVMTRPLFAYFKFPGGELKENILFRRVKPHSRLN